MTHLPIIIKCTFWCTMAYTSNKRVVILALKLQNEGGLVLTNRKVKAYNLLHNTLYKGKR